MLVDLCKKCREAIESAAADTYNDGYDVDYFSGYCNTTVKLEKDVEIEIICEDDVHTVAVCHHTTGELTNIENYIAQYLDKNADEAAAWQDAYDNDDWRDVDPGCDPAFPHYGDFERWAYGR